MGEYQTEAEYMTESRTKTGKEKVLHCTQRTLMLLQVFVAAVQQLLQLWLWLNSNKSESSVGMLEKNENEKRKEERKRENDTQVCH